MDSGADDGTLRHVSIARLADPLFLGLLLLLLGLWASWSRIGGFGRLLGVLPIAALWALGSPIGSHLLGMTVELPPQRIPLSAAVARKTTMVVLSGGFGSGDPYATPDERLDGAALRRLIGAARLFREWHFARVIVTGTGPAIAPRASVEGMRRVLEVYGVPADRIAEEPHARDTFENAKNTAAMLREAGQKSCVVVTSALHMRRALFEFERNGIKAIPASVDASGPWEFHPSHLIPSTLALYDSSRALHEMLGLLKPASLAGY